jgi:hypothetical protein
VSLSPRHHRYHLSTQNRYHLSTMSVGQTPRSGRETYDKIRSFGNLSVGWHYGTGGPATHEVIQVAEAYLKLCLLLGFAETDAFAGADGEVMITAYKGGHCIEVTTEPDRSIVVSHEYDGQNGVYVDNLTDTDAAHRVIEIAQAIEREQCSIFVSYMSDILTAGQVGSRTSHLRTPLMEAEFQSFWNHVELLKVGQYVPISNVITPVWGATLRHSGSSTIHPSLQEVASYRTHLTRGTPVTTC